MSPPVFHCPSNKKQLDKTTYLVVVGANSCFQPGKGRRLAEIVDPMSETVLVYEAEPSQAVHWMSPHDADEAMFTRSDEKSTTTHANGRNACFVDGSVRFLSSQIPKETLREFMTINDKSSSSTSE